MMIFWKERLAFLAVPKTGSTAIEAALAPHAAVTFARPPQFKHMTHKRFGRFIRPWLAMEGAEDIKVFAVMREPVSWLGSWYRYRARDALKGQPNSTQGISFDDFVLAYLQEEDRPDYAVLGSQAQQLSPKRNEPAVAHLFRYEEMHKVVDFLNDRFATRLELPTFNVSPKMAISLSPSVQRKLENKYPLDFSVYEAIGR